jgi:hypothetical protein
LKRILMEDRNDSANSRVVCILEKRIRSMQKAVLPCWFNPYRCDDLIRLGRDFDGGYLVSRQDIDNADILVSLGISDDWSFEKDFIKRNACRLYAYDASVNEKIFMHRLLTSIRRMENPRVLARHASVLLGYRKFFKGSREHVQKFVGTHDNVYYVGFDDVAEKIREGNAFLKIDIEGDEYTILERLAGASRHITGLVIEFHQCAQHLQEIKNFIRDSGLYLIHVHANNHEPVNDNGLPQVLEVTLSASAGQPVEKPILPDVLDRPNNRLSEEIAITISRNTTPAGWPARAFPSPPACANPRASAPQTQSRPPAGSGKTTALY